MEMNILKYMAFLKTVETGSFTKAAELLNYSQSGVSRMISDLEREWRIPLLERDRNGIRLTSDGSRLLPYAQLEYLECTHHVVRFHLLSGEDVMSLSLRVSFAEVARPLLADGRFLQPHRSYVVNLAAARLLTAGELQMSSGARIPIPRGREGMVREAVRSWTDR